MTGPEVWWPASGFEENYAVSDRGRVRNVVSGRLLRGVTHPDGYVRHQLTRWDGRRVWIFAHVLVLSTFVEPRPAGMEALHGDGRHTNNNLFNLRWGTHAENVQDSLRHGTHVAHPGSKNGRARLTEADIPAIRARLRSRDRVVDIAADYRVTPAAIHQIRRGNNWAHIPDVSETQGA